MTYESKLSNIIARLKEVKASNPELTIQKISEHTGISPSTVSRIFADGSENRSFQYESIKPIAKMLLDLDSLDEGAEDEKALKAIIQFKETAIVQLKQQIEDEKEKHIKKIEKERASSRQTIDFLKDQIRIKDKRIDILFEAVEDRKREYKKLHQQYVDVMQQLLDNKALIDEILRGKQNGKG